ncbi:MAG: peptidoglycan editing factor PgeF [Bryobacterales bacterium]|nr:peptidoglycan editing factor PgeF [Bryobacterales bacterium]
MTGLLQSPLLAQFGWLEHGFGTRDASPAPEDYANLKQTHSDIVVTVPARAKGLLGEGDGLIATSADVWVGIRTADCAPLILADPVRRVVAVVHAGWRGTVEGIALRAVEHMVSGQGSRPHDVVAAIGPAIGHCCLELGPEVTPRFAPWWPERRDLGERVYIDLPATLQRQLVSAGLSPARIETLSHCTRCDAARFHSYRRDGAAAGRMVSAARIRPTAR